jgi:CDP-3, 6-dideoxy-D-glycero-L-glycero-4-hexulose-4-reductase
VTTILVTGASGVLAKRFISKFSNEFKIISGVKNTVDLNTVQVDSWNEIKTQIKIDAVIHFAGKYLLDDSLLSCKLVNDATVGTATAVANFCRESRTPLLALGSYFEQAPSDMQPWSHYSIAKESAAKIFEIASLNYEIPMRYIYAYDTYGQDFSRRKIVDVLLDPKTEKLDLSPGQQKINLTHEDDFVEGIKMALEELLLIGGTFERFQLRNSQDEFTLQEVAETINSLRTKKIELNFGAKSYRNKEAFKVWDCAPNVVGWSPEINFKDFVSKYSGYHDE